MKNQLDKKESNIVSEKVETDNREPSLAESIKLRAELEYWEQKMGLKKAPLTAIIYDKYKDFARKYLYKHLKVKVNKKVYLRCCILGFLGVHHFYSGNYIKGIIYLLFLITGVTFALAILDYIEVKLLPEEDEGMVTLPRHLKKLSSSDKRTEEIRW